MKKILITGGPVHAHLDAVKIITNRFKGGLMAELAERLSVRNTEITFLCTAGLGAKKPTQKRNLLIREHAGFEDYRRLVLEMAPEMDAIVLGAAVANLIPLKPFKGKFPSHNYKPGDVIPIDFTIAPRVIDEVKSVATHAHLFGFKLLDGAPHEELIRAAYEIVLASGATAVFANDTVNLLQKFAVTKERAVHPIEQNRLAAWIWETINDKYYKTVFGRSRIIPEKARKKMRELLEGFASRFVVVENGMIFGTVAVRHKSGFITTGRGKRELNEMVFVAGVDHKKLEVSVAGSNKASLNAPLLAKIFENPAVDRIVHYHKEEHDIPVFPYAPPGTARDAKRKNNSSFNIKNHGCMLLFDEEGGRI